MGDGTLQFGSSADHAVKEAAILHNRLESYIFHNSHTVFFGHLVSQMEDDFFQIDFGWTYSNTGPAADAGSGDFFGFVQSLVKGGENNADG